MVTNRTVVKRIPPNNPNNIHFYIFNKISNTFLTLSMFVSSIHEKMAFLFNIEYTRHVLKYRYNDYLIFDILHRYFELQYHNISIIKPRYQLIRYKS